MAADAKYMVQAILDVKTRGGSAKKAQRYADSIVAAGNRIRTMGPSITRTFFGLHSALVLAGGAYGIGRLIKGAIDANREIENLNFSVATTLQLFGRNKRIIDATSGAILGQRDAAGMFAANLSEAATATDKLFRIAATSPASFQQAQQLFQNILPGIAQVEDSMENILQFSKKALSVGTLLGGDFKQAGADLRRILTGQAGMDVRAWAEGLSTAARRAAVSAGGDLNKLAKMTGSKFTQAFNQLDPAKRYGLMQSALKDLGASTEAAGSTWDGLTSAIKSDVFLLQKGFGEALFGGMKGKFKTLVGQGGIANPLSESFQKLEESAKVAGSFLAAAGGKIFDKLVAGTEYFAANWKTIYTKLAQAFSRGIKAAKLFLALRATQMVAGSAISAAGKGIGGAQKLVGFIKGFFVKGKWDQAASRFKTSSGTFVGGADAAAMRIKGLVAALGGLVPALGLVLPLVLTLGLGLAGLGVAFAGVAAYFIDNWDLVTQGIANGTVTLGPLASALGHLWAKLVALGQAIIGGDGAADATSKLNSVIILAAGAVHGIIGVFALFLRAAGVVQFAFNMVTLGLKSIAAGFVAVVDTILRMVRDMLSVFPGTGDVVSDLDAAIKATSGSIGDLFESSKQDTRDATKFFDLADVFEGAYDTEGNYAKALEDATKKALSDANKGAGAGSPGQKFAPAKNITVHNLRVEMDLRNKDPDRIMGAFVRKLEKVTNNPTQAMTHEDYGV